jgi:hypothetical protein
VFVRPPVWQGDNFVRRLLLLHSNEDLSVHCLRSKGDGRERERVTSAAPRVRSTRAGVAQIFADDTASVELLDS